MRLLLLEFNADNAELLARSIRRKFREAIIDHHVEAKAAVVALNAQSYDAIVVHRTDEFDAVELVRTVRQMAPRSVIIAVSGIDKSEDALAAGATGFLQYDEWLRLGTLIETALKAAGGDTEIS